MSPVRRRVSDCLILSPTHSRHSDRAKKMTSPSMLLSLDRPSPPAAAAALLLLWMLDVAAGDDDEEPVAVAGPEPMDIVVVEPPGPKSGSTGAGDSLMVRVKFAGLVDAAEVLGRVQVVVADEVVQSVPCWVAWAACWSGLLGLVLCAWARVVAPRAARRWEGRIGWWAGR